MNLAERARARERQRVMERARETYRLHLVHEHKYDDWMTQGTFWVELQQMHLRAHTFNWQPPDARMRIPHIHALACIPAEGTV